MNTPSGASRPPGALMLGLLRPTPPADILTFDRMRLLIQPQDAARCDLGRCLRATLETHLRQHRLIPKRVHPRT